MGKTVSAVVRLVDEFTSPSKKVASAARNLEKQFRDVGNKFKAVGGVFTATGETMTRAVSLPLAAVGTAALKFGADSENAMAQFSAATGTATAEMGKYEEAINNVYKANMGESINEVAAAMGTVKQNMQGIDGTALEDVTKYAITLSDTMGYDVAESTRAADTMMKNFGIGAEEAYNLMAQGAQNGLDYSGEMIDSINEYSVQFAKAGMDAEDMFNIMKAGAESGAFNLDKVGDAVKEFSIRAIDGSKTTQQGFEALGLNANEMASKFAAGGDSAKEAFNQVIQGLAGMDDPVAQNIAGVNLMGTMWEDLGPKAVLAMAQAGDSFDATKDSMEGMMAVKYDTLTGALGGLWRTIQTDVLQPIGQMLIPYIEKAIDKVGQLVNWWNNLEPATQKTIVKFAMFAAAVGPILLGVGKLTSGIGGMVTQFGRINGSLLKMTGQAGFKGLASLLTGPVGLAVAAVAAGAVLVYKNWDKIAPVVQKIADRFVAFWQTVQPQIQPFLDICGKVAEFIGGVFKTTFDVVIAGLSEGLVFFFNNASEIIDNVLGLFEGIITFLSGVFTGNWEKAWNGLRDIVSSAFGALAGLVKTPINAVISIVNGAISKINSISFTVPEWVPGIGGMGWKGLNIPKIPMLAVGTDNWNGGIAQINEKGGEIVDLPKGTRVYPHDESVRMAREDGRKTLSVNIAKLADSIIVREEADIDRIGDAIVRKFKEVSYNMG